MAALTPDVRLGGGAVPGGIHCRGPQAAPATGSRPWPHQRRLSPHSSCPHGLTRGQCSSAACTDAASVRVHTSGVCAIQPSV